MMCNFSLLLGQIPWFSRRSKWRLPGVCIANPGAPKLWNSKHEPRYTLLTICKPNWLNGGAKDFTGLGDSRTSYGGNNSPERPTTLAKKLNRLLSLGHNAPAEVKSTVWPKSQAKQVAGTKLQRQSGTIQDTNQKGETNLKGKSWLTITNHYQSLLTTGK